MIRLILSYKFNKSIGQDLVLNHKSFLNILGYSEYTTQSSYTDKYLEILRDLGYDITLNSSQCYDRLNLFHEGYPYITKTKKNKSYTPTELKYHYKLLKDANVMDRLYKELCDEVMKYNKSQMGI